MMSRPALWLLVLFAAIPIAGEVCAGEPTAYSDARFSAEQGAAGAIILETWAPWCLPCKIQAPIIERLTSTAEFRSMRVLRVGVETSPSIWQRFGLTGYGTIVVFRNGKEVARGTPTNEKALLDLLRAGP